MCCYSAAREPVAAIDEEISLLVAIPDRHWGFERFKRWNACALKRLEDRGGDEGGGNMAGQCGHIEMRRFDERRADRDFVGDHVLVMQAVGRAARRVERQGCAIGMAKRDLGKAAIDVA